MAEFSWDDLVDEAATPEVEITPGNYTLFTESVEYTTSKNGDPQFVIDYVVQGGEFDGKMIRSWLTAAASSDFSRRMFVKDIKTIAGDGVKLDLNNADPDVTAAPLVGKTVRAEVEMGDEFNGNPPRPQIKKLTSAQAVAPTADAPPAAAPAAAPADTPPPAPIA